ncbi:glycoside hydrolase family 38 C-terminal domain-containing protein [Aeoliella mucimassa]|uniref:Mannosylglycerate hydrolase n=1 Tax=Aeoliella mucimassa TaxID=2527972 RepID=A0A518AW44_9BACT|nr:glycoside hydrolase family 38 C-terminal domain-containing protein [Aeoliella mucimassa]QDU58944.1 hypothetical protein Pan181_51850 [Aeoliella mucimassa]
MKRYYALLLVACACFAPCLSSAEEPTQAYFVDGYHGGVYGHYPPGYTQFLVDRLEAHPEWKINLEIEPSTWDVAQHSEPAAYERLKELLRDQSSAGRIEMVNPTFAQSYFFQSSGESVVRQFQYGIRHLRQHFPDVELTTYSSEEPCFTSCLPTVLSQLGYEYAVLKNPNTCWGGYTSAHGGELVHWVGPNGTKLLTVPRYECESLHSRDCWQTIASTNSPEYIARCLEQGIANPVGMCLQDAGWRGGPWLGYSAGKHYTPSRYVTWREYFREVATATPKDWRFSQEDVKPGLMWGAQVLQRIAQQSREAEHRLLVAEKLAAMAYIETGHPRMTGALDDAWHNVLLSQHHDCWIVPYNGRPGNTWADQVQRWTSMANSISDLIAANALEALVRQGRSRQQGVRIFNPTATAIDAVVAVPLSDEGPRDSDWQSRDASGGTYPTQVVHNQATGERELLVRAHLPSLGYTTVSLSNRGQSTSVVTAATEGDQVVLESDLYRIVLNPTAGGTIASLVAKSLDNHEFVDSNGEWRFNELRGHFYNLGGFRSSADQPAEVRIVEQGPLRATVEVVGTIAEHPFVQRISLVQGSPMIECQVRIDWQSQPRIGEFEERDGWGNHRRAAYDDRYKLLVQFPSTLSSPKLVKNAPFDVCESQLDDSFYNSWEQIKHNVILDWVDLEDQQAGYGLAMFSDHTTSYAYGPQDPLGLTLQYAGKGLWARDYRVDGPTRVRYALVPHSGDWQSAGIPHLAASWQEPPVGAFARSGRPETRSLVDVGESGWQVCSMVEHHGDLYVRLFNATGTDQPQSLRMSFTAETTELVDLSGNVQQVLEPSLQEGQSVVDLSIPKYGIRTLRFRRLKRD